MWILTYLFGVCACVCAEYLWVSGFFSLWGIAGHFCGCGWRTWACPDGLAPASRTAARSRAGRRKSGISPPGQARLATFWEGGRGCPKFLAGSHPSMSVGAWGVDGRPSWAPGTRCGVGSRTGCGKARDADWTTANQIQSSLLFLFLSVLLRFSSPAPPPVVGAPSQMALECRSEADQNETTLQ